MAAIRTVALLTVTVADAAWSCSSRFDVIARVAATANRASGRSRRSLPSMSGSARASRKRKPLHTDLIEMAANAPSPRVGAGRET